MRLFAAITLPDSIRSELAALLDRLAARGWPVRWSRPDGLHLTLKFFGDVAPERLGEIGAALETAAAGTLPIPLSLTEPGAFPNPRHPRVLWIGIAADRALELLVDRIERASAALGFAAEAKVFHPHITLGRVRDGAVLPPGVLKQIPVIEEAFVADHLDLFESRPGAGGARYLSRAIAAFA
jgi:2'-5' RNA ligase